MGGVSIWEFFDGDEHLEKLEKVLEMARDLRVLRTGVAVDRLDEGGHHWPTTSLVDSSL